MLLLHSINGDNLSPGQHIYQEIKHYIYDVVKQTEFYRVLILEKIKLIHICMIISGEFCMH